MKMMLETQLISCQLLMFYTCQKAVMTSVSEGIWLLVTSCFQPSLLASNAACSTVKKRTEWISLFLPGRFGSLNVRHVGTTLMWICPGAYKYGQIVETSELDITPNSCEDERRLVLKQFNMQKGLIAVASNSLKGHTNALNNLAWEGSCSGGGIQKLTSPALTGLNFSVLS